MNSISKIAKNSTYLQITWNDGEESKFNYMWLRDNCPTAHDKDSRHRMFNILEVSKEINPKKYSLNGDGKLEIEWSEGDHTSYYDPKWLRENCYTIKNKQEYVSPYHLWDNNLENEFSSICIEHDEVINSDEGLIKWLELLHHKGIAIVKNSPTEKKSGFEILHIDPSIDIHNTLDTKTVLERIFELYEYSYSYAKSKGKEIIFEIGT